MLKGKKVCRPMLSDKRRETLGKMYSLVGTHSAVKLCRWQKSMLRGRGGCYKWSFYGIRSHQCMEGTPSLACANKCAFCWRHGTNPTATEWKFETDDPIATADDMIKAHKELIKNTSGVPGATDEKKLEAKTPRHCALSLVGEPILYPRVNEFLDRLHEHKISTFVVNNGQFPDALEAVRPVTQLYLSVDASNPQKMKELDRPIFTDFWERFQKSIEIMRHRKERTTFRLTMIKDYNMYDEDIAAYKDLFELGHPDFIELKQLTPSYNRKTSFLQLKNVPNWEEIVAFGEKLCQAVHNGELYQMAAVHRHSHCLLLCKKKFFIQGEVHTWIDFEKFHRLVVEKEPILTESYMLPTPDWAVFGSDAEGFDPQQTRHVSKKRAAHMERERENGGVKMQEVEN